MLVSFMLSVVHASVIYAECHLCQVSFKRSVANNPIMLTIIIRLNVIVLSIIYAECRGAVITFSDQE
jgi:hypothetical protein